MTTMASLQIPNKSVFKLNEVCGLTGVKPYVLRFWESEFPEIDPIISSSGQKLYEHKDIESIAFIKKILFEDKKNIEEAKAELKLRMHSPSFESSEMQVDQNEDAEESERPQYLSHAKRIGLEENDIQKLVGAKQRLQNLLELTTSMKERHNWMN